MTAFWVPNARPDEQDEVYAQLACSCGKPVPPIPERVEEITYVNDGEEWTATVGRTLRGARVDPRRPKSGTVHGATALRDPATVLAIFAGDPYLVVTDARPLGSVASAWGNPILAGRPRTVRYFTDGTVTRPG